MNSRKKLEIDAEGTVEPTEEIDMREIAKTDISKSHVAMIKEKARIIEVEDLIQHTYSLGPQGVNKTCDSE